VPTLSLGFTIDNEDRGCTAKAGVLKWHAQCVITGCSHQDTGSYIAQYARMALRLTPNFAAYSNASRIEPRTKAKRLCSLAQGDVSSSHRCAAHTLCNTVHRLTTFSISPVEAHTDWQKLPQTTVCAHSSRPPTLEAES
jgi:hypothetical protein